MQGKRREGLLLTLLCPINDLRKVSKPGGESGAVERDGRAGTETLHKDLRRRSRPHRGKRLKSWYSIEIYAVDWFRELGSLAVEAGIVVDVGRQLGGEGGRAPRASGIRLGRPSDVDRRLPVEYNTPRLSLEQHTLPRVEQHTPPCGIHTNN